MLQFKDISLNLFLFLLKILRTSINTFVYKLNEEPNKKAYSPSYTTLSHSAPAAAFFLYTDDHAVDSHFLHSLFLFGSKKERGNMCSFFSSSYFLEKIFSHSN